jgi:hypothetical protein
MIPAYVWVGECTRAPPAYPCSLNSYALYLGEFCEENDGYPTRY